MIWKKFEVELYNSTVYVCLEKDGEKVVERIKRAGFYISERDRDLILNKNLDGVACPLFGKDEATFLITVRSARKGSSADMGIIAHECDHIANFIFEYIGQGEGVPSRYDEFHAFLIGYIHEKSLSLMWSK